jgi:glutathione S-transferase
MSSMIVYGIPGSPYVRAALLTLEEKEADYKLAAMAPGTLKQQPHLSHHPFGRIRPSSMTAGCCTRRERLCGTLMP